MRITSLSALAILLLAPAAIAAAEEVVDNDVPLFNPTDCDLPLEVTADDLDTELSEECRLLLIRSDDGATVRIVPSPNATIRELGEEQAAHCSDTIQQVREENGQPMLQRGAASPDEPLLIAAVEQQIDGCSIMVMRNNTSDWRPLPERYEGPLLKPAW